MLGVAGAIVVARWLATMLFEVTPGDPLTLAATAGLLLLVAARSPAGQHRAAVAQHQRGGERRARAPARGQRGR